MQHYAGFRSAFPLRYRLTKSSSRVRTSNWSCKPLSQREAVVAAGAEAAAETAAGEEAATAGEMVAEMVVAAETETAGAAARAEIRIPAVRAEKRLRR
ncbi:hypothetical protein EMEDMD4_530101 [Sinorhizobium medicae]|uniref:Uncharacterized protein n=1 Tax=Sinorhizobium medicae TaxID=110321 RepID=A0A508X298_9HYPH|nr:hypothetical protein EMEDMD4_530101 [Sinorhizobium medicae]